MASRANRRSVDASLASRDKELAKWAKAMADAREGLDKIPAGWFNIEQLAEKFGSIKRGMFLRNSVSGNSAGTGKFSVNIPRAKGEKGIKATPNSAHACSIPRSG